MKIEQTSTKDDLNLREVTRFLNLDYNKLAREGQVKQLFETGVSKAMAVKIQTSGPEGKSIDLNTTARLAVGTNREGKPEIKMVFKNDTPKLDRYQNIDLTPNQQKELQRGNTLVVGDSSGREHIIKFDEQLNRVAGMKKSAFLAPEQLGSPKTGYTRLTNSQQAELKKGNAIEVEIGGTKVKAQLDPIERKLNIEKSPKQSLKINPATERKISKGPSL